MGTQASIGFLVRLAVSYSNLGQFMRASESAKKAFALRERVSERERYSIDAFFDSAVTGELEKANQVYEVWKQSYPRDDIPFRNLGDNCMRLGHWDKVLRETQECRAWSRTAESRQATSPRSNSRSTAQQRPGRLAKAREFSQRTIDSAIHADVKETAALWQVNAFLNLWKAADPDISVLRQAMAQFAELQ